MAFIFCVGCKNIKFNLRAIYVPNAVGGFECTMAGIENGGNHCFFNSLIQCILNRQEIRHGLFNHFTFHGAKRKRNGKL